MPKSNRPMSAEIVANVASARRTRILWDSRTAAKLALVSSVGLDTTTSNKVPRLGEGGRGGFRLPEVDAANDRHVGNRPLEMPSLASRKPIQDYS